MMITVYIFVAAAFLSVISMLIIFNVNIAKLKKDSGQISKVQKQFFIGAALSKIAPTLLLIFGILNMPKISRSVGAILLRATTLLLIYRKITRLNSSHVAI